jgi:FlaG/FlaF family flagellin (archaellin)
MVAITVILAAVIASFVLGLGGNNEPAPQPTIESESDSDAITFSQTGGDEFDATVTTLEFEATLINDSNDLEATVEDSIDLSSGGNNFDTADSGDSINSGELVVTGIDADESSAGDEFSFDASNVGLTGSDDEVDTIEWSIELIYNPSDQDSTIIYEDSS